MILVYHRTFKKSYIRSAENLSIYAEDESRRIDTSPAELIKLKKTPAFQAGEVYKKLSPKVKEKLEERLRLFAKDEFDSVLNNHALQGKWSGYRSINVTGDIRAIFKKGTEEIIFTAIDTHSNLYG